MRLFMFEIMRRPSRTRLLSPVLLLLLLLVLLLFAVATSAVPMPMPIPIPSSLDLLSQPASANANQAAPPLRGPSAKSALSFPVRPNPKGLIDYTRDMLDPILCPMAATGGGAASRTWSAKAKRGRGAAGRGDAGDMCAAWCARVKGEDKAAVDGDGAAARAGRCDDSGSCVCADGTTLLS